jgi:hypothetical protein
MKGIFSSVKIAFELFIPYAVKIRAKMGSRREAKRKKIASTKKRNRANVANELVASEGGAGNMR